MRSFAVSLLLGVLVGVPATAPGAAVCTVRDPRLVEVSGMVVDGSGYIVMNDGRPGVHTLNLYRLDSRCRVVGVVVDRAYDPFDTEDLARTADGTLWVADIGDNDRSRKKPTILRLPQGAAHGTRYTLQYPDGPHDAEAVLMRGDGTAVVVTKEITGVAEVFVTPGPLTGPAATVAVRSAGRVTIAPTTTHGGPLQGSTIVTTLVTGGAVAPDGHRVVLRTYTDAYEWDVPGGDIVKALVTGQPRRTPLPDEAQGESITYTPDGSGFVTASEGADQPLRRWTPAPPSSDGGSTASDGTSARASSGVAAPGRGARVSWIAALVGAAFAAGAAVALLLVMLLVRAARRAVRRRS